MKKLLCRIGLHTWRLKKTRQHKRKIVTYYVCRYCPARRKDIIRK